MSTPAGTFGPASFAITAGRRYTLVFTLDAASNPAIGIADDGTVSAADAPSPTDAAPNIPVPAPDGAGTGRFQRAPGSK